MQRVVNRLNETNLRTVRFKKTAIRTRDRKIEAIGALRQAGRFILT
jgi:hypothetical protein